MWERIGFTVGPDLVFGAQHRVFSDAQMWLEALQRTDCETGERSQYKATLWVATAP